MAKRCFLRGEGPCSGGMSREHYISRSLLQFIAGSRNTIDVSGLPWQDAENESIGIAALQSKILCQHHNSNLTHLDSAALKFFQSLHNIDKDPSLVGSHEVHSGIRIERWFVKALCGLTSVAGWGDGNVYPNWKKLLLGKTWPKRWGLYFAEPTALVVARKEFFLQCYQRPDTKKTVGVHSGFAGIPLNLLLHNPKGNYGTFRPDALEFNIPEGKRVLELQWPSRSGHAMLFNKVGTEKGGLWKNPA